MALYIDLSAGQGLDIDRGRIKLTVQDKNGKRTRLKIDADRSIPIRQVGRDAPCVCSPAKRGAE